MGQFLACGVATCISISKRGYKKDDILKDLKLKMNLNIFDVYDDEEVMCLVIKPDIFEKNIIDFIKSQIKDVQRWSEPSMMEYLDSFKGKSMEEMIEYSKVRKEPVFYYSQGYLEMCNIVSYIFTNVRCRATVDMIVYILNGKIIMEECFPIFEYLRNAIVKSTDNPLKDAVFVTIEG